MTRRIHSTRAAVAVLFVVQAVASSPGQAPASQDPESSYTVFFQSRPIGRESVAVVRRADGWLIRGSSQLGPPLDVTTRTAEVHYDAEWRPTHLLVEGISRGQDVTLKTTFQDGQASSEIVVRGQPTRRTDPVAADTVVLPNVFLGSYAALARRLVGRPAGAALRGFIAPQGEVAIRIDGVFSERIETPRRALRATRYALAVSNPVPAVALQMSVWIDEQGTLLRLSVPAQMLEVARDDVASAATRTTAFSLPGDETVRIPAAGFGLAASVTRPAGAAGRLPALILVGGSSQADRDGFVAGLPLLGQMAADFVAKGFLVVRYDKRGSGQSGGRAEASSLIDYAEDVRAIVTWLEKTRKDVDKKRIGLVGHGEGAWVAMTAAARDKRVAALVLVAGASTKGSDFILEQQRRMLDRLKLPDADRRAKIDLQMKINAAVLSGSGWDGIPVDVRRAADSQWFQSLLAYDPARVMRDVRQPVLIVHGLLDTEVPPLHAERLAALARARKRKVATDLVALPGVNHLLVPATAGEVDEFPSLSGKRIDETATSAIAAWMAKTLG
jgi:hypothetical protein